MKSLTEKEKVFLDSLLDWATNKIISKGINFTQLSKKLGLMEGLK
jgi:hypothetical protein